MSRSRVRFTIWSLMIAVAVVAVLLGIASAKRRMDLFRRLAVFHDTLARRYDDLAIEAEPVTPGSPCRLTCWSRNENGRQLRKARSAGLAANEAGRFDEAYRLLLPLTETGDVEIQARAMRLPRMTTRRWMIAVAVVALLIGGSIGGYRLKKWHDLFWTAPNIMR